MSFPIRCFTCSKIVGNRLESYLEGIESGKNQKVVLDELGFTRRCCRRMFLSYRQSIEDNLLLYHLPEGDRVKIDLPLVRKIEMNSS